MECQDTTKGRQFEPSIALSVQWSSYIVHSFTERAQCYQGREQMMQCVMSLHMWCSLGCFIIWSQTDKTLFRNTAHNLRLFFLSCSVVVASNTHITHTMKYSTLINIHSSQFISPPLLISYSYSCVYCVGPCVYAGMRSKYAVKDEAV
jgi:uncharacterized protein (DUF849 family)